MFGLFDLGMEQCAVVISDQGICETIALPLLQKPLSGDLGLVFIVKLWARNGKYSVLNGGGCKLDDVG